MCCGARLSAVELGAKGKAAELRDGELVTSKDGGAEAAAWGGRGLSLSAEAGLLSGQPEREVDAVSEA